MKILCVIVLYKCKLENSKSYQSLLQNNEETIFVYDNSPISQEVHVWGIERSGFFNGREKWAKGFENQRV